MPRPKNKYRKGHIIYGMDELLARLNKGEYVYLRDRAIHPGWLMSMQLKTVYGYLELRFVSTAVNQQKEYYEKMNERINAPISL